MFNLKRYERSKLIFPKGIITIPKARLIADALIRATGNISKHNEILEFIIESFEKISYENSMDFISIKKTQQVFKQCKILPETQRKFDLQRSKENFETIIQSECYYYLNKYGTPEKQIIHYERNNQLGKAFE